MSERNSAEWYARYAVLNRELAASYDVAAKNWPPSDLELDDVDGCWNRLQDVDADSLATHPMLEAAARAIFELGEKYGPERTDLTPGRVFDALLDRLIAYRIAEKRALGD